MIINIDLFEQSVGSNTLLPETFIVTEQCPGQIVSQDQSGHLD